MNEAKIWIAYDGEALRSGAMNVRDLAPALMALSDLFEETNKVINNKDSAVQLRVQADFRAGSFDICIQIDYAWATKLLHLFAGESATGLANLLSILGFTASVTTGATIGLIKLIKWLRGRPVQKIEIVDDVNMRVIVEGDHIEISKDLASVFNDLAVRRALAAMLEPLQREGVDVFEVRENNNETIERVKKEELVFFEPPIPAASAPEPILSNEFTQAFTLISVAFRDNNKWRVSDGQNTINVTIADPEFIARVNNRDELFAKDDTVLCKIRQEQAIGSDGSLKTESTILKVLEHQHAPRQTIIKFPKRPSDKPPPG